MKTKQNRYRYLLPAIGIMLMVCGIMACGKTGVTSQKAPDGNDVADAAPMGRYIESEWKIPELPTGKATQIMAITREGNKCIITLTGAEGQNFYSYSSEDGENWERIDEEVLSSPLTEGETRLGDAYRSEKGDYYSFVLEEPEHSVLLHKTEADGTQVSIPIEWKDYDSMSTFCLRTDTDDAIYFITGGKLCRYAQDGKQLLEYQNIGEADSFAIYEDKIAVCSSETKKIMILDRNTGEEQNQITIDDSMVVENDTPLIDYDEQGNLILCSKVGIFCLANGGALFEKLFDGTTGSIGMPAFYTGIICAATDRFLVYLGDGYEEIKLLEYRYHAEIPLHPTEILNVAALGSNKTVEQAIRQYQIDHPDVQIIMNQFYDSSSSMTKADAIRTLNTEILSGNGPDVLVLDGIPIDSYIEKGILLDITEPIEKMIAEDSLYPSIVGALRKESGIYAVPTKFKVPVLVTEPANLPKAASLHALAEMVRKEPNQRIFYNIYPESLMKQFFDTCSSSWKNGGGEMDQTAFAEFLEDIKTLSENTYGPDLDSDIQAAWEGKQGTTEEKLKMADSLAAVRTGFGKSLYCPKTITSIDHLMWIDGLSKQLLGENYKPGNAAECLMPIPGEKETGKKYFMPSAILGINAKSEQTELALDFVKTALSKEVQKYVMSDGISVNAEAMEDMYTVKDMASSEDAPDGDSYNVLYPSIEAQKAFIAFAAASDTPVFEDEEYYQMAVEESQAFFEGKSTAAQTAAAFASRSKTYLSE